MGKDANLGEPRSRSPASLGHFQEGNSIRRNFGNCLLVFADKLEKRPEQSRALKDQEKYLGKSSSAFLRCFRQFSEIFSTNLKQSAGEEADITWRRAAVPVHKPGTVPPSHGAPL